jgi:hypothetical protein
MPHSATLETFQLQQNIYAAIGMPMRRSDGAFLLGGHEICCRTEDDELAFLAGVTMGEGVTTKTLIREGGAIVLNGTEATKAAIKALATMQLTYIVLPNAINGYAFGRIVTTDVFAMKNTTNNKRMTSVLLDKHEFQKLSQFYGCISSDDGIDCNMFFEAMGQASAELGACRWDMNKVLRIQRQVTAIEEPVAARGNQRQTIEERGNQRQTIEERGNQRQTIEERGNGRTLRSLAVRPVYYEAAEQEEEQGIEQEVEEACASNHPSGRPRKGGERLIAVRAVGRMDKHARFVPVSWKKSVEMVVENVMLKQELQRLNGVTAAGGYAAAIFQTPSPSVQEAQFEVCRRALEEQRQVLIQQRSQIQRDEMAALQITQERELRELRERELREREENDQGLGILRSPGDYLGFGSPGDNLGFGILGSPIDNLGLGLLGSDSPLCTGSPAFWATPRRTPRRR